MPERVITANRAGWISAVKDHKSRVNAQRTDRAERRVAYTHTEIDAITNTKQASRKYIHLTDGGVADNIGLREPLTAITGINNSWSVLQRINLKQVDKLVVIVVNAATNPETQRDKTPKVPGLLDTVMTVATIPLDNYSFETLELLRTTVDDFNEEMRLVSGCKELAAGKGPQCELDIPMPHHVEFFPVEVAFEYIEIGPRSKLVQEPSDQFELPRETVDKLREVGRQILREDPQFKKLMEELR